MNHQRSLTRKSWMRNIKPLVLNFQKTPSSSDLVITNRTLAPSHGSTYGENEIRTLNLDQVKFILKTFFFTLCSFQCAVKSHTRHVYMGCRHMGRKS